MDRKGSGGVIGLLGVIRGVGDAAAMLEEGGVTS